MHFPVTVSCSGSIRSPSGGNPQSRLLWSTYFSTVSVLVLCVHEKVKVWLVVPTRKEKIRKKFHCSIIKLLTYSVLPEVASCLFYVLPISFLSHILGLPFYKDTRRHNPVSYFYLEEHLLLGVLRSKVYLSNYLLSCYYVPGIWDL